MRSPIEIQAELISVLKRLKQALGDNQELRARALALAEELAIARERANSAEIALLDMRARLENVEAEVASLKAENARLKAENASQKVENARLEAEVASLTEDTDALEGRIQELVSEVEQLLTEVLAMPKAAEVLYAVARAGGSMPRATLESRLGISRAQLGQRGRDTRSLIRMTGDQVTMTPQVRDLILSRSAG